MTDRNREQQRKHDEAMTGSGTRRTEPLLSGTRGGAATASRHAGIAPKRDEQMGDTPHPEQPAEGPLMPELSGAERAEMGVRSAADRSRRP
jgi:hypothetical protein